MTTPLRIGIDVKQEGREYGLTSRDIDIIDCAALADAAGFESFWTNEDIGYDSTALLSAASQRTRTIRLGTAIANVYTRSAMQLAMGAATLDDLSGGRALLGLSVGHHPWNDLGHGIPLEAPFARLREYVQYIRKVVSGEPFTHDGRFFKGVQSQLHFQPLRPSIPIHIAAVRPQMIKLAAEEGDGLIVNVVGPEYIGSFVTEHFRSSARAAGRDPDQLEITALVTCCVSEQREDALAMARRTFINRIRRGPGMVDVLPAYRHEEIYYLCNLIQEGKREQAESEASEELVTSVMNAGNVDDVWRGFQKFFDAGCTRVVAVAFPRGRADIERLIAALAPRLKASPSLV